MTRNSYLPTAAGGLNHAGLPLDPEESPVHDTPGRVSVPVPSVGDQYMAFRHHGFGRMRSHVLTLLSSQPHQDKRARAYATCGSGAWVQRTDTDPPKYRIVANACKDRFCPACQQTRARRIAANLREQVGPGRWRFITLTIKSQPDGLGPCVDRIYSLFRTFRRTRAWKQHVCGGVAFFEVTLNPETKKWHPHFHLICQGSFWKLDDLRAAWLAHTGDSHIVDIQSVDDFDHVSRYVVKYASKGFDPTIWRSEEALSEAIDVLSHTKLIFSFGRFRRLKLLKKPLSEANWLPVEPAHRLIRRALAGDSAAETLCRRLWGRRWVQYLGSTYACSDTS